MRDALERGGRRVIVPLRPGLSVVRGAVMLGLGASERFSSRLAKYTYAVECAPELDPANPAHRGRLTFEDEHLGRRRRFVLGRLSVVVRRGARIRLREVHQGSELGIVGAAGGPERETPFALYAAESPDGGWTDDRGVAMVGRVMVRARPGDKMRVDLAFGASEIRATVVNRTTGAVTPASIQYDFRSLARCS